MLWILRIVLYFVMNWSNDPQQPKAVQKQAVSFYSKVTPGKVKGTVSDYREALITLAQESIRIEGRSVLPQETQIPIMILGIPVGVLVVALILEYAVRQSRIDELRWNEIEEIVLEPHKKRACIVYQNPKKPHKFFSLAFALGENYEDFVTSARQFVPTKVHEGKIKSAISPVIWVFLGLITALDLLWLRSVRHVRLSNNETG
jgi:hypothetical protein